MATSPLDTLGTVLHIFCQLLFPRVTKSCGKLNIECYQFVINPLVLEGQTFDRLLSTINWNKINDTGKYHCEILNSQSFYFLLTGIGYHFLWS